MTKATTHWRAGPGASRTLCRQAIVTAPSRITPDLIVDRGAPATCRACQQIMDDHPRPDDAA